jgi:hypothetical protein
VIGPSLGTDDTGGDARQQESVNDEREREQESTDILALLPRINEVY